MLTCFLRRLTLFLRRLTLSSPITECYIDHRRGYIHIAYDAEDNNTWPFISK